MLSAVELHTGPGGIGIYSHHPPFGRPSTGSSSAHHQQMPLASTTIAPQQQTPPMSGTEFARPKPKSIGSMNGLSLSNSSSSSPTQKYSHHEQNGPVNLAVNHQNSRGSPPSKSSAAAEHLDQKEIDVVGLGMSSSSPIGSPMSYATTSSRISSYPANLGANAYQALNYSFYSNRYASPLFPHRSAYPQHHPNRPTYLPPQLDNYPSYLPSPTAPYTSNTVGGYSTNISSPSAEISSATHKQTSERSHSLSSMSNGHHPYALKEKEPKSAGPRIGNGGLVDETRSSSSSNNNNNNFKVPSGKEGSLKHRILTTSRPHGDKHGTINHPANRSPLSNNSLLNFTRGSLIELSNGTLRRVEDLRTEDFIMSAEKSADLQLADSTVVKILPSSNHNYVIITFSYDNNRSKVDIEAKLEHPFFVYGQGWASCHTEGSMASFGLKCQRLQVGDVCISLKPRELKIEPQLSPMAAQKRTIQQRENLYHQQMKEQQQQQQHQQQQQQQHHQQQQQQQQQQELMPQNLSRRPSTIPTSSADVSINSPMAQYSPALYSLQMSLFAAASQGRIPPSYATFLNDDAGAASAHLTHELNTSLNNNNSTDKLPLMMSKNQHSSDEYAEDLQSRKRRWSAPDIEEEQHQQQQQQQHQQSRKVAN